MVPRAVFSIASLSDSTESEREGGERKRGREEEGEKGGRAEEVEFCFRLSIANSSRKIKDLLYFGKLAPLRERF